jgi:EAL domain-containing protein (putative c-di-GMP-specific phosphodiesterase class I)
MISTTRNNLNILNDAERGLAEDEFFLVFQPTLRPQERRLTGFEALIRWQHPLSGVLEPSSFISVVEDSELSSRFTDWLLTRAAVTLANWISQGHDGLTLAINMPAAELTRADLPEKLRQLFNVRNLHANQLQIELTGVVEPAQLDFLSDAIDAVKATGISVALDDFGAGFTSLTLLHQLPVDILKIAGSYIARVPEDVESTTILETLIRLGQRLGKQIVLEGVETRAQFDWVQGIPHVDCQGYYISAPVGAGQLDRVIAWHGQSHCSSSTWHAAPVVAR